MNPSKNSQNFSECINKENNFQKFIFLILSFPFLIWLIYMEKYFLFFVFLFITIINFVYQCIPKYKASEDYEKIYSNKSEGVKIFKEGSTIVLSPIKSEIGLIFYQGAFVENKAYIPMLYECAKEGIRVYIVKMPLNIGTLNMHCGIKIVNTHKEIKHWYLGGHSLGGVISCFHIMKYRNIYEGVILLGSYFTKDISSFKERFLLISASNDGVMSKEKFIKNRHFLPSNTKEIKIEGGNHSQFGNYGFQKGDNKATITREEQQNIIIKSILEFINKKDI